MAVSPCILRRLWPNLPPLLLPPYYYSRSHTTLAASASEKQRPISPNLVALEYADLNLSHGVSPDLGHVRIRQHVNPLSASFSAPMEVPDWNQVFRDPTLPLMVDIGSAGQACSVLDPHFKKRHHKRRVVQKPLVDSIINSLVPGGQVFIQSDVLEVAVDMRNQFDSEANSLKHIDELDSTVLCDRDGWLLRNPMGIRTEREIHAEYEGARIYRRMYQKHV